MDDYLNTVMQIRKLRSERAMGQAARALRDVADAERSLFLAEQDLEMAMQESEMAGSHAIKLDKSNEESIETTFARSIWRRQAAMDKIEAANRAIRYEIAVTQDVKQQAQEAAEDAAVHNRALERLGGLVDIIRAEERAEAEKSEEDAMADINTANHLDHHSGAAK